jgi:hypothetical protein
MNVSILRGFFTVMSAFSATCCALVYWMFAQDLPSPTSRAMTTWLPTAAEAATTAIIEASQDGYPESFARPIFMPRRRPFVPPQQDIVAPPAVEVPLMPLPAPPVLDASQLVLKGVRLNKGVQQALIFSPTIAAAKWLSLGNEVDGFQLVAIADDRATLQAGGQKIEIKLYDDKRSN